MAKIPYILVVGDDDVANRTVGVNRRGATDNKPQRGVGVADFVSEVVDEVLRRGSPEDAVAETAPA